jgi:hypothetical protein
MKDTTETVVSQLDFAHNGLEYLIRVLRRETQRKDIVRAYIKLTIKILESAEELLDPEEI